MERCTQKGMDTLMKFDSFDLAEMNKKLYLILGNKEETMLYLIDVEKCFKVDRELKLEEELQHIRLVRGVEGMFNNVRFERMQCLQCHQRQIVLITKLVEHNKDAYIDICLYELNEDLDLMFLHWEQRQREDEDWEIRCVDNKLWLE